MDRAGHGVSRVLLAKVGFDGHDRGLKVVARVLRDAGLEVVYAGLRQTPESVAAAALQEDVDVIGLSMHNGAHLTLTAAVAEALHRVGLTTPIVVGGIVPAVDVTQVEQAGAAAIIGPGASSDEIVATIEHAMAN
jgi:methylmalonyl-CoA mutase, C-terminal domain